MSQTIAEKILAAKAGLERVKPGQIVDAYPDLVMSHTATWRSVSVMKKIGAKRLYDPNRLAIVLDHISPAKTEKYAADQQTSRNFAREYGIEKFYDVDAGIAHLVLMEHGHVKPGDLIVGTDSHCTIYGALGALGSGIGYTEVASVWVTGKLWMKVPTTIKLTLNGRFAAGVSAKDLMLYLIGTLGADGCGYKSVEFYGSALPQMSVSERMTMANLAMEMGSKCVFIPPDEKTSEWLLPRLKDPASYQPVFADPEAVYEQSIDIDLAKLTPMIACPHQVENTKPVAEVMGTRIDQAFLGSCANGKYEDLVVAADILAGRKIDPRVRLIVTPGSKEIMLEAMRTGVLATLIESGALVTNPGCGACAGDGGTMADGEVSLSTANRNFVGRMGSNKSSIYLSSPATLAASALKGAIADPREFLR
ncbi:3-isopropylmalate dehydratase large subunit [Peristeroidobacter soli]|uniref:3-isopropylmalate dehydratase large subunit n=1 Tax=Peristeroidobacter soli TaxID=2497877 RepID=UPI00101D3831|nr:3-isopropylmalate dehydratase large subunit [Peristeroidobacter soli]